MRAEEFVHTSKFLNDIESKYGGVRRVTGRMGEWFFSDLKLFFDCKGKAKKRCAENIFASPDLGTLIVYFVVRDQDGCQLRDCRFKNIYSQNLRRMIKHFHNVLEPSITFGFQVRGLTYIECIGYEAVIVKRVTKTISDIMVIKKIIEEEAVLEYQLIEEKGKPETKILCPTDSGSNLVSVAQIQIFDDTVVLYATKDKDLKKPNYESGPEWDKYLKSVSWKDAMSLSLKEKYYGTLLTFDPESVSYKVELNYPVEEKKLRQAFQALNESKKIQ